MPDSCSVIFPNSNELFRFDLYITPPEDCFWSGGRFRFTIEVPQEYNILVRFLLIQIINKITIILLT